MQIHYTALVKIWQTENEDPPTVDRYGKVSPVTKAKATRELAGITVQANSLAELTAKVQGHIALVTE